LKNGAPAKHESKQQVSAPGLCCCLLTKGPEGVQGRKRAIPPYARNFSVGSVLSGENAWPQATQTQRKGSVTQIHCAGREKPREAKGSIHRHPGRRRQTFRWEHRQTASGMKKKNEWTEIRPVVYRVQSTQKKRGRNKTGRKKGNNERKKGRAQIFSGE